MSAARILIIGGYGTFGGRLVQLLADETRLTLIVAGRSREKADALALGPLRAGVGANDLDDSRHEQAAEKQRNQHARGDAVCRIEAPPKPPHVADQVVGGERHDSELCGDKPAEGSDDLFDVLC